MVIGYNLQATIVGMRSPLLSISGFLSHWYIYIELDDLLISSTTSEGSTCVDGPYRRWISWAIDLTNLCRSQTIKYHLHSSLGETDKHERKPKKTSWQSREVWRLNIPSQFSSNIFPVTWTLQAVYVKALCFFAWRILLVKWKLKKKR